MLHECKRIYRQRTSMNGKGVQFSHTHHSVLKNQMFHSTLETLMYTDMIQNQTEAQKTRGKMWEV